PRPRTSRICARNLPPRRIEGRARSCANTCCGCCEPVAWTNPQRKLIPPGRGRPFSPPPRSPLSVIKLERGTPPQDAQPFDAAPPPQLRAEPAALRYTQRSLKEVNQPDRKRTP